MFLNRKIEKKEAIFWILTGFWAGVIWGLSSITPGNMPSPGIDFPFAFSAHFILYFALAGFLYGALNESKPDMPRPKVVSVVLLCCVLYGVIDEVHQSFVPGRHPSAYDVFTDALGASCFLAAASIKNKLSGIRGGELLGES